MHWKSANVQQEPCIDTCTPAYSVGVPSGEEQHFIRLLRLPRGVMIDWIQHLVISISSVWTYTLSAPRLRKQVYAAATAATCLHMKGEQRRHLSDSKIR